PAGTVAAASSTAPASTRPKLGRHLRAGWFTVESGTSGALRSDTLPPMLKTRADEKSGEFGPGHTAVVGVIARLGTYPGFPRKMRRAAHGSSAEPLPGQPGPARSKA